MTSGGLLEVAMNESQSPGGGVWCWDPIRESDVQIRTEQNFCRTRVSRLFPQLSERQTVRFRDGGYECAHCAEVLDLPAFADPQVVMRATAGTPNVRVLTFKSLEIHRCDVVGLNRTLPDRSGMRCPAT